jgi:hypothetical protein
MAFVGLATFTAIVHGPVSAVRPCGVHMLHMCVFGAPQATAALACGFEAVVSWPCAPQDEPAYCGLSTLVMVLNALSIDPHRSWKGVWRWFSEDMVRARGGGGVA